VLDPERWSVELPGLFEALAVHEGSVYATAGDAVKAIDAESGG
jgi:hypothetical protein